MKMDIGRIGKAAAMGGACLALAGAFAAPVPATQNAAQQVTGQPGIERAQAKMTTLKLAQPINAWPSRTMVMYKNARYKTQTVQIRVSGAKGRIHYQKNHVFSRKSIRDDGRVYVDQKGKVTFRKGVKKGTYRFLVWASSNVQYRQSNVVVVSIDVR